MEKQKNSDYWKERFQQLEEARNQQSVTVYADIDREYRKAQNTIETSIQTWCNRFAVNNEISFNEAKKRLNASELKEFKWTVQEYIEKGQVNAFSSEWMRELENASTKFHVSRLEMLKTQIQQATETVFGNQLDSVDKLVRNSFKDAYYQSVFEIQKGFNTAWNIAQVNENKLSTLLAKPWAADGRNFSERIWGNKNKLMSEIQTELTQMCLLGKGPQKAIDNIVRKMKVSRSQAGALVSTESAYFSSLAQEECFNDLGVEQYQIIATLDNLTSTICQELDGKVYNMKDYRAGSTAPPFHVHCRSCTAPYFDDDFGERIARGEDGKTYHVPSDITYSEWEEKAILKTDMSELQKADYLKSAREEQEITDDLKKIISSTGGELTGLEYRLKTPESYMRKINEDMVKKGITETEAINSIYDTVRYTSISSSENYVKSYVDIVEKLEDKCYTLNRVKNTWINSHSAYKGVNTIIESPSGQRFELQFHTRESFDLKQGELHKLYEEARLSETSQERCDELVSSMVKLSSKLVEPPGISRIKGRGD